MHNRLTGCIQPVQCCMQPVVAGRHGRKKWIFGQKRGGFVDIRLNSPGIGGPSLLGTSVSAAFHRSAYAIEGKQMVPGCNGQNEQSGEGAAVD